MTVKLETNKSGDILLKGFVNACHLLELNQDDMAKILGISKPALEQMVFNDRTLEPATSQGERALHFIRIYNALSNVTGGDQELIQHWFLTKNKVLKGIPLDIVKSSQGLQSVEQYLESLLNKN